MDELKRCTKCGCGKPLDAFYRTSRTKCGRRSACKSCEEQLKAAGRQSAAPERRAEQAAYARRLRARDPAAHRAAVKKWAMQNVELVAAKQRRWSKANPCYGRDWRQRNAARVRHLQELRQQRDPLANRLRCSAYRARRRAAEGSYSQADVADLHRLQRGRCAACSTSLKRGFHVDHVQPLARGGANRRSNLQLLCPLCNKAKSARIPEEFMQSRGFLL